METKLEMKIRIRKIGKLVLQLTATLLVAAMLLFDYACISRTTWYTHVGWDFMRAARKTASEVAEDIEEVWNLVSRKIGLGPQWTESWPIANANISWVALYDKGERRN